MCQVSYAPVDYDLLPRDQDVEMARKARSPEGSFMAGLGAEWPPLDMTDATARELVKIVGNGTARIKREASEEAFKEDLRGGKPNSVCFLTHGYADTSDPLGKSCLAFVGANVPQNKKNTVDDGLLTGFEITSLDMKRVNLVYHAACMTGYGIPKGGEGIMSLRRAFHSAGVRDLVSTLFPVRQGPMMATTEMFFRNAVKGIPPDEALRAAKLSVIAEMRSGRYMGDKTNRFPHPLIWAGPVLSR